MKKCFILLIVLLIAQASFTQSRMDSDLWIYENTEVVDSVKADSIYIAYTTILKEKMTQVYAEPIMKIISEIDHLMECEAHGNKIEPSDPLFRRLLFCVQNGKDITSRDQKEVSKGKVPKGFTEKVLKPSKDRLQAKIDNYSPQNIPSWDNVFVHHIDKFEITYDSQEYQEFDIGNIYGNQTRYVRMGRAELPIKNVAVPKPNPNCRDNYFNGSFNPTSYRTSWDEAQQRAGWEWALDDMHEYKKTTYPIELGYWLYESHPEYRYIGEVPGKLGAMYNKGGKLVRILGQWDDGDVKKKALEQLCKRDFLSNKYDIKSAKAETLTALRIHFELTSGMDARFVKYTKLAQEARDEKVTAATIEQYNAAQKKQNEALNVLMEYMAKEREPHALKYIAQLESDHADDFKWLYKIYRVDDLTFKFYYLNSRFECGCIVQMTWKNDGPYQAQYKIEVLPNETITIRK